MNKKNKLKTPLPENTKLSNGDKIEKLKDKSPQDVKKTHNNNIVKSEHLEKPNDLKWYKGVCKWFNSSKGWGFLNVDPDTTTKSKTDTKDTPGGDIFVYQAAITKEGFRSLGPGENVEFQVSRELLSFLMMSTFEHYVPKIK